MGKQVLLFGGTTEGSRLFVFCRDQRIPVTLFVATPYGAQGLKIGPEAAIQVGRLEEAAVEARLRKGDVSLVLDATHPYATQVTANLRAACEKTGTVYLRVTRQLGDTAGTLQFSSCQEAAAYLAATSGNILLTTGSRQIDAFAGLVPRVFARVLPVAQSIEACRQAGIEGRNLLCMQGPFSADFTYATLHEFDCRFLVTKNAGRAGGYEEKIEAARRAGAQVLVIQAPEETGLTVEQAQAYLQGLAAKERGRLDG